VTTKYLIPIDPGASGYHLEVGLYDQSSGARLPVNGSDNVRLTQFG